MSRLLQIENLRTHFHTRAGAVRAVDGVELALDEGEVLGLVGESGSGKSVTAFSIIGLIDPPGVISGSVRFRGEELVGADPQRLRELRGKAISMVFQDPMMTLTPVLKIETQMVEAVVAHERVSHRAARDRAVEVLGRVGIPSPSERIGAYPHQFSGGMRQRVAIAIALLHRPALILADEPTTALDVTIQGQILGQMQELVAQTGSAMIWITHDLAVVEAIADNIAVMYAGKIVEFGPASDIINVPGHPYTRGLLDSIPSKAHRGERLRQIPGMTPSLLALPRGCAFAPRCPQACDACTEPPPVVETADRWVRCVTPFHEAGAAAS